MVTQITVRIETVILFLENKCELCYLYSKKKIPET